ncbi:MAG: DUF3192 domain-containing protein [Thermodesulfobacteriota bacterium]
MKKLTLVALLLFATLAAACSGPYSNMKTNRENLVRLKAGMTMAEVEEVMGKPDFKDVLSLEGAERTTLWYFTNELGSKGFTAAVSRATVTREDCTPLVFKGGKLFMSGDFAKKYL